MNDIATAADSAPRRAAVSKTVVAAVTLFVVVVLGLPPFLRQPLTNDPVYYDLQADNVAAGGVLYRDMAEPNFPGVVWLHLAARAVLGSSSEAIRFVDFLILASSTALLVLALRRWQCSWSTNLFCAAGLFWCYLPLAEWSHVQRDTWQLFPAGLAMLLRERLTLSGTSKTRSQIALLAFAEGTVWGIAVWIKPHIIIPAAAVWLTSVLIRRAWRVTLIELVGLLAGGAAMGCLGSWWLIRHQAWEPFWNTLLVLNPQYYVGVRDAWSLAFFLQMCGRLFPWLLVHVVAIPFAAASILKIVFAPAVGSQAAEPISSNNQVHSRMALWSVLYLGWMFHALFLQILFDYVHVPCLLLGIVLLAFWCAQRTASVANSIVVGLALLAVFVSPLTSWQRIQLWPQCVFGPNSATLRNQLRRVAEPNWEDLERVAAFLETQQLRHGDLVCYNNHLIHLYPRLGIRPTIRYVYQKTYQRILAQRVDELNRDLQLHPPRFIVSDLSGIGVAMATGDDNDPSHPPRLPDDFPAAARSKYPWRYPLVFRAGSILVHEYRDASRGN